MDEKCFCDTGKLYTECCQPLISNKAVAKAPVDLMRARYTAYAKGEIDFIYNSIAPDKQPDYDKKGIEDWSKKTDWKGLEIISTNLGGPEDESGEVEFIASYREKDTQKKHHEIASFIKIDEKWFFEDGKQGSVKQVKREAPKIGRNDPCHCGSGKKFKKCHGLN